MSNTFTLDSLREEVEKKYAPVKIGLKDGSEVTLRNLIRMDKKERKLVLDLLDALKDSDGKSEDDLDSEEVDDLIATVGKILPIIAETAARGRKLASEIGDDFALTTLVLERWMGATKLGEAPNSPA